ncbi:MAG TPA: hypothetical protein VMT36_08520, partial [Candidatus Saccharimonadia bacterium]|nr:hypothetical protein [Candidatus Saccharimonadia bacterium]
RLVILAEGEFGQIGSKTAMGVIRYGRDVISGVPVDRDRLAEDLPTLVIGGGLDHEFPEPESERLAEWLGAEYQPYGAHSHYGLVIGEDAFEQVATAIRGFLDAHRL